MLLRVYAILLMRITGETDYDPNIQHQLFKRLGKKLAHHDFGFDAPLGYLISYMCESWC